MIYSILRRILGRHVWWHLVIPLLAGVGAEIIYTRVLERTEWSALLDHLLSGPRIALYVGIVVTYLLVIFFRIRRETNIGLKQLDLMQAFCYRSVVLLPMSGQIKSSVPWCKHVNELVNGE